MSNCLVNCSQEIYWGGERYRFSWRIYRHSSNKGSVIEYKDACYFRKKMVVLDAEYRTPDLKFFKSSIKSSYASLPSYNITGSIGDKNISAIHPIPQGFIDNLYVYSKFKQMSNYPNASTANSAWLNIDSCPSITAARNCTIIDNSMQYSACIPTLYQLIVIWAFSDSIDELDVTAESYPDRKLGYTASPSGRFPKAWSVTQGPISSGFLTILGIASCQIYTCGTVSGIALVIPIVEI